MCFARAGYKGGLRKERPMIGVRRHRDFDVGVLQNRAERKSVGIHRE